MGTAPLPSFVWVLYYYFLIITLATSVIILFSLSNYKKMSAINIVFAITVPIIAFAGAAGTRHHMHLLSDLNEIGLLIYGLRQGALSAYYVVLGLLFILAWWFFLVFKIKKSETTLSFRQAATGSLLVGIIILLFGEITSVSPGWRFLPFAILGGGFYFLIFNTGYVFRRFSKI